MFISGEVFGDPNMKELPADIINFLEKQGFVIVSTLDKNGSIHCSAKGIVGLEKEGRVYLIDIYRKKTLANLKRNPTLSLTAVDEHHFVGYTLKGRAKIVEKEKIEDRIIKRWEERVVARISKRIIGNIRADRKFSHQPEARFPFPKYLIVVEVEHIVDLAPAHLRKSQPPL